MIRLALVAALAACGGKPAPVQPPKPAAPDPAAIAASLHADLVKLRDIASAHKEKCPELVTALRPHIEAMRAHHVEVERVRRDAELAVKLRTEVDAYADRSRGLADEIGTNLAASWKTCVPQREELKKLIDQIPEIP